MGKLLGPVMGFPVYLVLADHLDLCKNPQSNFFYLPSQGIFMAVSYNKLEKVKLARTEHLKARENRHAPLPGSLLSFALKPLGEPLHIFGSQ